MKIPKEIDLNSVSFPAPSSADSSNASDNNSQAAGTGSKNELQEISLSHIKGIVQLASQTWRLSSVLKDAETDQPKTELNSQDIRKLSNIAEAMQEIILNLGVRVIDRCGEDFHPGLPDVVVTEEPKEGISKERIIRTIRPTILHGQTMVQRGEIDIAVPMEKTP